MLAFPSTCCSPRGFLERCLLASEKLELLSPPPFPLTKTTRNNNQQVSVFELPTGQGPFRPRDLFYEYQERKSFQLVFCKDFIVRAEQQSFLKQRKPTLILLCKDHFLSVYFLKAVLCIRTSAMASTYKSRLVYFSSFYRVFP